MAVQVQSISSAVFETSGNQITITKPSGVAVGNLLVTYLGGTQTNVTTLSGWTLLTTQISSSGNCQGKVYWKIADSGDVSATDYTWVGITSDLTTGCMVRIDGQHSTNPVAVFAKDGAPVNTTTPAFNITVTPGNANSVLLYFISSYDASTSSTASGYNVATSNPSWTEIFDNTVDVGVAFQASAAYATRPEVTATGNAGVTMTNTQDEFTGIMVVVKPSIVSTSTETESVVDTLVRGVTKTLSETESVVDTLTKTKQRDWDNQSKSASTWTNETKT